MLGYDVVTWELNAADVGVPQNRRRLFVVGNKHGFPMVRPSPVRGTPVTVHDAIADLPILANGAHDDCLAYRSSVLCQKSCDMTQ
jgi:DNA (cytosine-5)-methyltransferase 1